MPKPCPPTDSDRCTPCRPCSAAAFQYGGGLGIGVSSASCSTSDGATRATRDSHGIGQVVVLGKDRDGHCAALLYRLTLSINRWVGTEGTCCPRSSGSGVARSATTTTAEITMKTPTAHMPALSLPVNWLRAPVA